LKKKYDVNRIKLDFIIFFRTSKYIMYGSNYGGSYGTMGSYGSYGSYNSPYSTSAMMGTMRNQQNPQQLNNQQPPDQNESKFFYFIQGKKVF